jgi:uncharacterized protein (TIGR03067 family)
MRSSFISTSVCVLLFGVSSAYSEEAKDRDDIDGIAWGEVVNGLQLGISPPVTLSATHEFVGFDGPMFDGGTLHVTVHLRNVGKSHVRFLPSVWDCLAMGDAGAIPVSKLTLTPEKGGKSLTVTYQGWNHLRLLDKRRPESESWQETLCQSAPGAEDMQLDSEEGKDRQVELAAGDAVWPEWVKVSLGKESKTPWQLTEKSRTIPAGKYRVAAVLVVDQQVSEWKGALTSGALDVAFGVLGDAQGNDDAKGLLGIWEYVSVTYEGKPFDVGKDATITIAKDSWTDRRNEKTVLSTWKVDASKSPKQLTRVIKGGKVNFLERSIYRLDKDQLVICESAYYGRRPKKFVARKGDSQYLIVLRRQGTQRKTVSHK